MRCAALLMTLLFALAAPADAQTPPLRGGQPTQTPAPPPESRAPIAPSLAIVPPPALSTGAPASQCRLSCAQSYYFCLASDTPDDCPGAWSQCRAACGTSNPRGGD
jgi:hypothetical protein